MHTDTHEIADDVFRLSTYVPEGDFTFNQFLVRADEPLIFHTGPRRMFPLVSEAVARLMPLEDLRWITFGHVEADESGSMNDWLAVAPAATVAHTAIGCVVSVEDLADRPPRPLADGEVIDLGGKRVRHVSTPHVPHGWDAGVLFEETTGTLFCGDLFSALGAHAPLTTDDVVGPAIAAEDVFGATCLTPSTARTIASLAELAPRRLALMHGPTFEGDAVDALRSLAAAYQERHDAAVGLGV
jgi:flavorubredoxin